MSNKKTTPERLAAFSDGVSSVIIMVLDLKPPAEATLKALLPLWPAASVSELLRNTPTIAAFTFSGA